MSSSTCDFIEPAASAAVTVTLWGGTARTVAWGFEPFTSAQVLSSEKTDKGWSQALVISWLGCSSCGAQDSFLFSELQAYVCEAPCLILLTGLLGD